jgi:hypothetical protein
VKIEKRIEKGGNFGLRIADLAARSAMGLAEGLRKWSVSVSVRRIRNVKRASSPVILTPQVGQSLARELKSDKEWLTADGQGSKLREANPKSAIRNPKFF